MATSENKISQRVQQILTAEAKFVQPYFGEVTSELAQLARLNALRYSLAQRRFFLDIVVDPQSDIDKRIDAGIGVIAYQKGIIKALNRGDWTGIKHNLLSEATHNKTLLQKRQSLTNLANILDKDPK